ncbi:hypothetical protein [Anaerorhabdus sp.]|jgi:hypothetical protein|uniref:hypothetical protein n=1 Tax=Anaerorhabdus sp. TaxID=1872524 RepID=UPI002FC9590C
MKMKKICCLLLCVLLSGCVTKPDNADMLMDVFFTKLTSFDFPTLNNYLETPIDDTIQNEFTSVTESANTSKTTIEALKILKDLDISWVQIESNDSYALFNLTIKYYGLNIIKEDYLELFIEAFKYHADNDKYDEQIAKAYNIAYQKSLPTLSKEFIIECKNINGEWKITDANELISQIISVFKKQIAQIN